MVVLPEMTLTGFTMDAHTVAEPAQGSATVSSFEGLARAYAVHIAFGVVLHGRTRPRNTLVVAGPDGEVARYAKVHPFTYAGEAEAYEAGDSLVVAAVGGMRFGLSICYDLRFAEQYAALAPAVDAFLVIANWPARRIAHWEVLLRARAIETQAWVLGVNRTGVDGNGVEYPPSTYVFSPRGDAVQPEVVDGAVAVYDVSGSEAADWRASFPVLPDRRPDVYRGIRR